MSKHTPGPWSIHHEFNVFDENGRCVASCGGYSSNFRDVEPENRANAMLIAAAPDLLEACRALLAAHSGICEGDGDMGEDEDCARARAAIAKAEGR